MAGFKCRRCTGYVLRNFARVWEFRRDCDSCFCTNATTDLAWAVHTNDYSRCKQDSCRETNEYVPAVTRSLFVAVSVIERSSLAIFERLSQQRSETVWPALALLRWTLEFASFCNCKITDDGFRTFYITLKCRRGSFSNDASNLAMGLMKFVRSVHNRRSFTPILKPMINLVVICCLGM